MRIAVVGARGQLGGAIVHELQPDHDLHPLDRSALDVTRPDDVEAVIDAIRPEAIINCTGYNAVDAAEAHPVEALSVNAIALATLARSARVCGAMLVHYSSDFVFDGRHDRPYTEEDAPNPRSVYATSKLLGEWLALQAPAAWVLRVASLFDSAPGAAAEGSVATIVEALRSGRAARVFSDRIVTPTSVVDAARATRLILERRIPTGLYHCVNSGSGTWVDIAREAARILGIEPHLEIVRMADVTMPAERPIYCVLSNEKLARAGVTMPSWQDALGRSLRRVGNEPRDQAPDRQTGRETG
ncbi:MAG: dTDP-4-dehydrorhamnose reductase [Vicinamibacterales bacterium]